jgi:hypothetical protein
LKMEVEAQAGICRFSCNEQWSPDLYGTGMQENSRTLWKNPSYR